MKLSHTFEGRSRLISLAYEVMGALAFNMANHTDAEALGAMSEAFAIKAEAAAAIALLKKAKGGKPLLEERAITARARRAKAGSYPQA